MESSRRFSYLTLAVLLLAVVIAIAAPGPRATDPRMLSEARTGHAAALVGGKVLITGGMSGTREVAQAELFDPSSQTFEPAGFSAPRSRHTATTFDETHVLVAGGEESGLALDTSEVFDVDSDVLRPGPRLGVARAGHSATALADHRVVIVGGDETGTIELFTDDRFEMAKARLRTPRSGHSAQRLADGSVLIVGGFTRDGQAAIDAEIYDPSSDTIRPAGQLSSPRLHPELRLLPDGKVQVIGGDVESTMEIFEPAGGYFTARAHLLLLPKAQLLRTPARALALEHDGPAMASEASVMPRSGFSVTELPEQHLAIVVGGATGNGNAVRTVSILSASVATITTDRADYPPDTQVSITGAGWLPGESVTIAVVADGSADPRSPLSSVADANGNFVNTQFRTTAADVGVTFILTATGGTSGYTATTSFTDRASANLDQCANGTVAPFTTCEWVNGNLGASKATYLEGDSVAYRMRFGDLTVGASHTITFAWDTTKTGKHALDYLTTVNRTVTGADPCLGVSGCSGFTTYPIPVDPAVAGGGVTQVPGNFRLYGGTITGVSAYSVNGLYLGSSSTYVTVTFTADVATPVLAWGGHIATRADWGVDAAAVSIPGSPYHMMLMSLDGSGGAQDRSLSAEAVIYPATVKVIKDAVPDSSQSFAFTTSGGPLSNFSLVDDGSSSNTKLFGNIITFGSMSVVETSLTGWKLTGLACTENMQTGTTVNLATGTANISLDEGEDVVCTFTNTQQKATLTVIKHVVNDNGGAAVAGDFTMKVTGNSPSKASFPGAESPGTTVTIDPGAFSVDEDAFAGYTKSFSGDCSGTLAAGESKTCTVTNDDQQAYVTVTKVVNNTHGGTARPDDFKLTLAGNATTSGAKVPVSPGTYTAAETLLAGYSFDGFSGDCGADGKVTVKLGESKTCTLTNSDSQAYVIVEKKVVNDNGGSAKPDDFKLTLDGNGTTSGTKVAVNPGTYTAAETQLAGYTFTGFSGDCGNDGKVTVALGETKTCTLTNDDQQAFVVVNKVVVNDNGGSAKPDDFKLTLDGNGTTSGTKVAVNPGTYTAAEKQLAGYTFTGSSGDCGNDGKVTVALGETKTCTLTNDDQQAFVVVNKVVVNDNGGSAKPDDFKLTLDGNATTSGTKVAVNPGTYTAAETQLAGYTFTGFSGDCGNDGKVRVALGETKTCTLTNDDQQAFVIVNKVVINDNGGSAAPDDFKLTIGGNPATSGTRIPVTPGAFTAAETQLPGYTFAGFSGDCDANGKVTVGLGETKVCTLTNDDQQAFVIVNKVVINDNGGSAAPDDFKLTLGGNPTTSGAKIPVTPGAFTAAETQLPGYTFAGFSGDCDSNGKVTVGLGETKVCTLTNDDQQAFVIVNKVVINDNGGSAAPDDFKLTIGGSPTTSGTKVAVAPGGYTAGETQLPGYTFTGFSGDCDSNGKVTVGLGEVKVCTLTNDDQQAFVIVNKVVINDNGGSAAPDDFKLTIGGNLTTSGTKVAVTPGGYIAGETQLPGYTFAGFSGDCDANGKVTVALGEVKVCTLTNDDQQAFVIVNKVVVNDNGGSAKPDDFKLTLGGNPTTSGAKIPVTPGAFTAAETQLPGYTFAGFSGDCDSNGKVTVALGEVKVCTLTNDDQQAFVIVNKVVINDNGGSAAPDDFKLTLGGNPTTSGTKVPVNPGGYTAAETQLPGYTFTGFSGDCDSNGKVTVALGETKVCTLTNDDQQAFVIVNKVVINDNGGSAAPDDFKLTLGGNPTTSGTKIPVTPGAFTAGETPLPGYTFKGFSGDCDTNGKVTVALGETKTCTLTNDDQQAFVIVNKVVINDNGGSAAPDDFKLTLGGNPTTSGTKIPVTPGAFTAGETPLPGYTFKGFSGDCDTNGKVTVALGETKTCTLTNDDQQAYVIVNKVVINDNGGSAAPDDFRLTLGGNPTTSGTKVAVNPGTHVAGETLLSTYTFAGFTGGCDAAGKVTVALGETKTCTLTNDDKPAMLIVKKHVIDGGSKTAADFTMRVSAVNPDKTQFAGSESGTAVLLSAGAYRVTEADAPGFATTYSTDCSGTIAAGQTKTCTVTNVKNSIFTNSMLCMIPSNQFKNLLLQDPANPATFNLNATNPGQFYYNAFYSGTPGTAVSLDLALPYPFITQGATPVHVYSGFTSDNTCFTPVGDVSGGFTITATGGHVSANGSAIITLPDYVPQALGSVAEVHVRGVIPSTGFIYVTIHLDFGLKQTGNWTPDAGNGAHQGSTLVLADPQSYQFTTSADGSLLGTEKPTSTNVFKKNPGVAGFVQNASDSGPVQGIVLTLKNGAGTVVGTFTSDDNGFYLISYKHTGKAAEYTVTAAFPTPQTKTVTLKANALAMVNFLDPLH